MAKSIEDRYIGMAENAKTRSIVSIGISCFQLDKVTKSADDHKMYEDLTPLSQYTVWTYNLITLCSEEYVVEPKSLQFLINHGFDFNHQYSIGISYHRGNDQEGTEEKDKKTLRQLFTEIILARRPVVFHNGLMDLIYLYQNLYAALPTQMSSFLADLTEIFPGGIYDTKYISDFVQMMPASYLEYVFRQSHRENFTRRQEKKSSVIIRFLDNSMEEQVHYCKCPLLTESVNNVQSCSKEVIEVMRRAVCESFAGHGWCEFGVNCKMSHDMDLILDLDILGQTREVRKRKRREKNKQQKASKTTNIDEDKEVDIDFKTEHISGNSDHKVGQCSDNAVKLPEKYIKDRSDAESAGCHRSGFDSFMTGFSLAVYITKYSTNTTADTSDLGIQQFKNNISLSGKDMPLSISKSGFAKTSKEHRDKIVRIKSV